MVPSAFRGSNAALCLDVSHVLICWVMLGVFALGYCEASHDHECPGMYLKDCICHISGSSDFPRVTKLFSTADRPVHTPIVCVCVCVS